MEGRRVLKEADLVSVSPVSSGPSMMSPVWVTFAGRDAQPEEVIHLGCVDSGAVGLSFQVLQFKFSSFGVPQTRTPSRQQPPRGVTRTLRVAVVTQLRCFREVITGQEPRERGWAGAIVSPSIFEDC